jgi:hypothetical protein
MIGDHFVEFSKIQFLHKGVHLVIFPIITFMRMGVVQTNQIVIPDSM